MNSQPLVLFGVPLLALHRDEMLNRCRTFLSNGQHVIATVNPEFLMEARKNADFRSFLTTTDLNVLDGFGILLVSVLKGKFGLRRMTGVAMTLELCRIAAAERKSVFLLGGFDDVPRRAAIALQRRIPNLRIAGAENEWNQSGRRLSDHDVLESIRRSQPDILFVALGQVRQEFWIRDNLRALPSVRIAMGVGGTFDFLSGNIRRAPDVLRRMGLEWVWRLLLQPWRWKRIFTAVIRFPIAALFANKP